MDEGKSKIQRADLDGANAEDLLAPTTVRPEDIALDAKAGKLYWVDNVGLRKGIRRSNKDGTRVQEVLVVDGTIGGIFLDVHARKLYWTETAENVENPLGRIRRVNLEGGETETVLTMNACCPTALAVDAEHGHVYWGSQSNVDGDPSRGFVGGIHRALLDGSEVQDLKISDLAFPAGIALDVHSGKMYWTDKITFKVQRAELDGTQVEDLLGVACPSPDPIALDIDAGRLYVGSSRPGMVCTANLDGSDFELLSIPGSRISGLALDLGEGSMYWTRLIPAAIHRAALDGSDATVILQRRPAIRGPLVLTDSRESMHWLSDDPASLWHSGLDGSEPRKSLAMDFEHPSSFALDFDAGKVYWTDPADRIGRSDLDGSQAEILIANDFLGAWDVALDPAHGMLYWANYDENGIYRASLDGSGFQNVLAIRYVNEVQLDPDVGRIFWLAYGKILRMDLDGSHTLEVVGPTMKAPLALALDAEGGRMYWTDGDGTGGGKVFHANVDGSGVDFFRVASPPLGIALDTSNRKLYWTLPENRMQPDEPVIQRANLDGSSVESIPFRRAGAPFGIAIDAAAGILYLASQGGIYRVDRDGGDAQYLAGLGLSGPSGIALDTINEKVYWTGGFQKRIHRANLDGSASEVVVPAGLTDPLGLAVDPAVGKMYWTVGAYVKAAGLDGSNVVRVHVGSGPAGIAVNSNAGLVYWTDRYAKKIQRGSRSGGPVADLVENTDRYARSMTFDPVDRKLYWTENHGIFRSNDDGRTVEPLATGLGSDTYLGHSIVVNPSTRKVYWSAPYPNNRIIRANLDGSSLEVLYSCPDDCYSFSIVLDSERGRMYWTQIRRVPGHPESKILYADLNGLNVEEFKIDAPPPLVFPGGLAVDPVAGKLYWTDSRGDRIRRADFDGANTEDVLRVRLRSPRNILLNPNEGKIYWSSGVGGGAIQRASLDGTGLEDTLLERSPDGLAMDVQAAKLYWSQFVDSGSELYSFIRRSNLDGTQQANIIALRARQVASSLAVDPDGGRLYWVETNTIFTPTESSIRRATIDGSQIEQLVAGLSDRVSLALNLQPHISVVRPPDCTIDPRQPHDLSVPEIRNGWDGMELEFSAPVAALEPSDFQLTEWGDDGIPPTIRKVERLSSSLVRITLQYTIDSGAWTCANHLASGSQSCVAALPGDVSADGSVEAADLIRLINCLDSPDACDLTHCDIDRSRTCNPQDILREVDLLQGSDAFTAWGGVRILECP